MGFELKNSADQRLLQSSPVTVHDLNAATLQYEPFTLSYPYGEMKAMQWLFQGIRIIYSDSVLQHPMEMDWSGDLETVTMYFNLRGRISMQSAGWDQSFELGSHQHNMFYGQAAEGKMRFEDLRLQSFMVQFTREAFLRIAGDSNDALKRFADQVARGKPIALSPHSLPMDLEIQHCIRAVIRNRFSDALQPLFLLSKSMELLVLQAESYNQRLVAKPVYVKTAYDQERIRFAKEYLLQHMEAPPSLSELAKVAGINEFKLKRGFKELYGTTAFGYLSEKRLELAREALLDRQRTVTQIAADLGYASVQHFSHAFKKKFGVSPGQVK